MIMDHAGIMNHAIKHEEMKHIISNHFILYHVKSYHESFLIYHESYLNDL